MKKKKLKFVLIPLVIIVFGVAVYFCSDFLATKKLHFVSVCIAKTDLKNRTCIREDDLKVISIPEDYLNDDTYTDAKDIVGKYVVTDGFIAKGSLFYKDYLETVTEMNDGYFTRLEDGKSSYDLSVKDISCNTASLKEGQYIDLYLTINRKEVISDLLISGAKIIGLYDNRNNEITQNSDTTVSTITIALDKEMIPFLNKALAIGEISISTNANLYDFQKTEMNLSDEMRNYLS